jgi:hypothetical protein
LAFQAGIDPFQWRPPGTARISGLTKSKNAGDASDETASNLITFIGVYGRRSFERGCFWLSMPCQAGFSAVSESKMSDSYYGLA